MSDVVKAAVATVVDGGHLSLEAARSAMGAPTRRAPVSSR